jgi:hypothetical protein
MRNIETENALEIFGVLLIIAAAGMWDFRVAVLLTGVAFVLVAHVKSAQEGTADGDTTPEPGPADAPTPPVPRV